MAKIINNPVTSTFSGGVGEDLVFRQVGNRAFVVKKPVRKKPATPAERTSRHLFAEAQIYAQVTLLDPELVSGTPSWLKSTTFKAHIALPRMIF